MALTDYVGETPRDVDAGLVVERVTTHHRWDPNAEAREHCSNCGTELDLAERHLLATLTSRSYRRGERRYLCDENCVREWIRER
jgi:hypothetical protein